jgi:hypothetical protein
MEIPMTMTMTRTMAIGAVALAALAGAGPAGAHHSGFAYETTPIWIKGSVVSYEIANPHSIITLEGMSADGQVRRFAVEGPALSQFARLGIDMDSPKVGDSIEFCAFPYKPVDELSRLWPDVDFSARRSALAGDGEPRLIEGHVMVLPDGTKRFWDPHGLISECMRLSEEPDQAWIDFLNADGNARQAWCEQRGRAGVQANASLRVLIEDVNSLIDAPCE